MRRTNIAQVGACGTGTGSSRQSLFIVPRSPHPMPLLPVPGHHFPARFISGCTSGLLFGALNLFSFAPAPRTVGEWLVQLPTVPTWEAALRAGTLEPIDLDALPQTLELPDPLRRPDGFEVRDPIMWAAHRQELLKLFQYYLTGTLPPAPRTSRVVESTSGRDGRVTRHTYVLKFSPRFDAQLNLEVLTPPGPGPFPALVVPETNRTWATIAVSRGYLATIYAASDRRDDTVSFASLDPGSDWTLLAKRAWAIARCLDFLITRSDVDPSKIALAGEGRHATQALVAAAFDERIAAVIVASSGAGGAVPFRLTGEDRMREGIEGVTRHSPTWLHPRLRFFSGQESRLPIDQNQLVACVAPRACLLSTAFNDPTESVWAVEQAWRSARRVYGIFKQEGALQLHHRTHGSGTRPVDVESYLDWLDGRFDRGIAPSPSAPLYPTYADWQRLSGERIDPSRFPSASVTAVLGPMARRPLRSRTDWLEQRLGVLGRVGWVLGESPALGTSPIDPANVESEAEALTLHRTRVPPESSKSTLGFGSGLHGTLYQPVGATAAQPVPAILWIPPVPLPLGYLPGVRETDLTFFDSWIKAGYAVFAFDPIGAGGRIEEVRRFYDRHPHWSLLGRTLQDARDAVDALLQQKIVDRQRIFVVGYGTGGFTALHAAAFDDRIAGVISVHGFAPLRDVGVEKIAGSNIARWSHLFPLLPRLGAFVGQEDHVPYDLDEVLALIAPRPVTLVRSLRDGLGSTAGVQTRLDNARSVYALYDRAAALRLFEVDDDLRYSPEVARETFRAIKTLDTP